MDHLNQWMSSEVEFRDKRLRGNYNLAEFTNRVTTVSRSTTTRATTKAKGTSTTTTTSQFYVYQCAAGFGSVR